MALFTNIPAALKPAAQIFNGKTLGSSRRLALIAMVLVIPTLAAAQTNSFTYQGRFTDGGTAANGVYDMQFRLFDSSGVGTGNQIGSTVTNGAVAVVNGVFNVQLSFGGGAFSGPDRFLELGVRAAGSSDPYTIMSPRQQLTSSVYAIRALSAATADAATNAANATNATNATNANNSAQLGGVDANQYVLTTDPRLTVSGNFIQNTTSQQAASNFNISGNGTAGGVLSGTTVNSSTQYNIAGNRVFAVNGAGTAANSNTVAGVGAGTSLAPTPIGGNLNSFFGAMAGNATVGGNNSFFGAGAGQSNTQGTNNAFFGASAGNLNTDHQGNAFFGSSTGFNTNADNNSFFGYLAGFQNTIGSDNTFVGKATGFSTTEGYDNTFIGETAGSSNVTGHSNTLIGFNANVGSNNLVNATAIGAGAFVTQSNSVILGSSANVGIGTHAPNAKLHIELNNGNILVGDAGCNPGFAGLGFAASLTCTNYSLLGNGSDTIINRTAGGNIDFRENNSTQMTIASGGVVTINALGSAGSTSLCRNGSNQISTCSSSLRYKKDLRPFTRGLALLNQLKPITFKWKGDNLPDLGFAAEEVAAVEPLLTTRNDKGEVEGVKYDRLTAVLVNAVKEQEQLMARQDEQIKRQQEVIESLRALVCRRNRHATVCR